jgi:phosphatidate cytidylyltransferase
MSNELIRRIVTAVIGVPVILFLLWSESVIGWFILASVISAGMLTEYLFLMFEKSRAKSFVAPALFYVAITCALVCYREEYLVFWIPLLFIKTFSWSLWFARQNKEVKIDDVHSSAKLFFGALYCVIAPCLLIAIRQMENGRTWAFLGLWMVWAADTGAYFVGRAVGKTKLFPLVSPGKTVEGAIGGWVLAAGISLLYRHLFSLTVSPTILVLGAVLIAMTSQVGDLCESLLKRAVGVKDSGKLLPGHGGFLDRFDGVVFALPVLYALLKVGVF